MSERLVSLPLPTTAKATPAAAHPLSPSMVAHDLRGPIRQIMALAVIAADTEDRDERRSLLEDIRAVAARLALLLDHLMLLDEPAHDAGAAGPLSLRGPASSAARFFAEQIASLGGSVEIRGDVRVGGDGILLEQLFRNLIGNAIKYRGEAPPEIDIKLSQDGGAAVVHVADYGLGVPEAKRAAIFEPSVRVHQNDAEGHGVGLALCRQIAAAHGAVLTAIAPRADESTCFELRFSAPADRQDVSITKP